MEVLNSSVGYTASYVTRDVCYALGRFHLCAYFFFILLFFKLKAFIFTFSLYAEMCILYIKFELFPSTFAHLLFELKASIKKVHAYN